MIAVKTVETSGKSRREAGERVIFVSRDLEPRSLLARRLEDRGFRVIARSLIRITPIRFTFTPETDWVFFSSKNAIRHFFEQSPTLRGNVKFAVLSKASAKELSRFGKQADFIGTGNDVRTIAKDFSAKIESGTVLFPQALDSLQTVQRNISFSNTCFNLYVYKTSPCTDFELPNAHVLIFTSPSNVSSYFSKYRPLPHQRFIAMGQATLTKLKAYGVKDAELPVSFDERGLLEAADRTLVL